MHQDMEWFPGDDQSLYNLSIFCLIGANHSIADGKSEGPIWNNVPDPRKQLRNDLKEKWETYSFLLHLGMEMLLVHVNNYWSSLLLLVSW